MPSLTMQQGFRTSQQCPWEVRRRPPPARAQGRQHDGRCNHEANEAAVHVILERRRNAELARYHGLMKLSEALRVAASEWVTTELELQRAVFAVVLGSCDANEGAGMDEDQPPAPDAQCDATDVTSAPLSAQAPEGHGLSDGQGPAQVGM